MSDKVPDRDAFSDPRPKVFQMREDFSKVRFPTVFDDSEEFVKTNVVNWMLSSGIKPRILPFCIFDSLGVVSNLTWNSFLINPPIPVLRKPIENYLSKTIFQKIDVNIGFNVVVRLLYERAFEVWLDFMSPWSSG